MLAAAVIVVFALTRGEAGVELSPETIRSQGYGLSGPELVQLTASPGTEILVSEDSARAVQVQSRGESPPSAGVFLTLPPAAEEAFSQQDLLVTWRIRREVGFGNVEIGYFTLGAGDSGWRRAEIDEAFQDITLRFTPGKSDGTGFDYAGLWPGTGDPDGVPVFIESVRVEVAP